MAAVLSNGGGFYGPRPYLSEAERLGLTILPPDVNESGWEYRGKGRDLRVGLMPIKGLSRRCIKRIVEERDTQRFENFADFITRVEPAKADALLLLKAGALDSLGNGLGRIGMAWYIRAYGNNGTVRYAPSRLKGLPCGDLAEETRHAQEVGALGFPVSFHPLQLFRNRIDRLNRKPLPAAALSQHIGKPVTMAGWPIAGKGTSTRKGEPMEFVSLEDETDTFEATFFPRAYRKFCRTISFSRPLILKGVVEEQYGAVSLRVEGVEAL
jgi:error-prone DNA polymerase